MLRCQHGQLLQIGLTARSTPFRTASISTLSQCKYKVKLAVHFLSRVIFRLGLFSCITGLVAAWKDHHFIYINVIWLASFIAASYLIKLIWELIFFFLAPEPSQTWLIWIKYICGLLIYTLQGSQSLFQGFKKIYFHISVIFALMDRARILRNYFSVNLDEISK